jgi:hypothetical protein
MNGRFPNARNWRWLPYGFISQTNSDPDDSARRDRGAQMPAVSKVPQRRLGDLGNDSCSRTAAGTPHADQPEDHEPERRQPKHP